MAIITLVSLEDLKKVVKFVSSDSHLVVTDGISYVWLVPLKSSRHRHYFLLKTPDPKEVSEALKLLKNLDQVHGSVTVGKE